MLRHKPEKGTKKERKERKKRRKKKSSNTLKLAVTLVNR